MLRGGEIEWKVVWNEMEILYVGFNDINDLSIILYLLVIWLVIILVVFDSVGKYFILIM